jgi:Bacterial protein of unknown function (DUF899)
MQYADASDKLARCRQQIAELRGKMRALQQSVEPQEVSDYEFSTTEGKVRLSELFGDKEYLFVIHNMGAGCPNCICGRTASTASSRTSKIALPLLSPHRTSRPRSRNSKPLAAGGSAWSRTSTPALSAKWVTTATRAGYRACRSSANAGKQSAASLTPASMRETISARSGTSSTYCRKVPMAGNRNTSTSDTGGHDASS